MHVSTHIGYEHFRKCQPLDYAGLLAVTNNNIITSLTLRSLSTDDEAALLREDRLVPSSPESID